MKPRALLAALPVKTLTTSGMRKAGGKNHVFCQPSAQLLETLILMVETKYNETAPFLDRLVIVTTVVALSCETLRATEQEENERVHM